MKEDILAQETLEAWAASSEGRFTCKNVLSEEPDRLPWTAREALISRALIEEHSIPAPTDDSYLCMRAARHAVSLCGPRNEHRSSGGVPAEMGYTAEQVVSFNHPCLRLFAAPIGQGI